MNISTEFLQELKCYQCEKFLTCGPIYIRNTSGEAICGRCTLHKDEPVTRNKQYEIIARKILFPCTYTKNGCTEKIQFSENKYNTHEENCRYRDRICPVGKSGECEWIGPWTKLVEHCQKAHPNNVLNNPCTLQHDITAESLNAYIVSAFDLLFILHVKVCVKSAKIYHSLRYLGSPKSASNFKFKLDVQRGEVMLSKPGKVASAVILTIQINSSLELCVNSLLGFLGGFDGTTFTVTVQRAEKFAAATSKVLTPILLKETNIPIPNHEPLKSQCARKYSGCDYRETEKKCRTHEQYYCPYLTSCFLCNTPMKIGQVQWHYLLNHSGVTHNAGKTFCINPATVSTWEYCLITNPFGNLVCWYTFNDLHFEIEIITPLSSVQLEKYQCSVHIKNSECKYQTIIILPRSINSNSDWSDKIKRSNVTANVNKFHIAVSVDKI